MSAESATLTSRIVDEPWLTLGPSSAAHPPVRILDTLKMPLTRGGTFPLPPGWGTKVLFQRPGGATLEILHIPPGAEGAPLHYHEFHEWAYLLDGDFTNNESTTPRNYSILQRFRQGHFLSRPPFSLHGGEKGRMKWMASQTGAQILNMGEADVSAGTFSVDPADAIRPPAERTIPYNADHEAISHWATPRIIDTVDHMPWQPAEGSPGLHVKYLLDDPSHGFRASIYFLEAHAPRPDLLRPHFYGEALQLVFMIAGELETETSASAESTPARMTLGPRYFVERPPGSIFGLRAAPTTVSGAAWLEITYARGHSWTDLLTPIGPPTFI